MKGKMSGDDEEGIEDWWSLGCTENWMRLQLRGSLCRRHDNAAGLNNTGTSVTSQTVAVVAAGVPLSVDARLDEFFEHGELLHAALQDQLRRHQRLPVRELR